MTIIKFAEQFPDENSCKVDFKQKREKEGVICKKCACTKHYWLADKWQWQCSNCRFRTTLRSGTMLESSKLSFRMWYLTIAFMSFSKKGVSALEMQRQLGHKFYEPVWAMMHKIRKSMGKRDEKYNLSDMIEFDEGYFEVETSEKEQENLKRGRGSQKTEFTGKRKLNEFRVVLFRNRKCERSEAEKSKANNYLTLFFTLCCRVYPHMHRHYGHVTG